MFNHFILGTNLPELPEFTGVGNDQTGSMEARNFPHLPLTGFHNVPPGNHHETFAWGDQPAAGAYGLHYTHLGDLVAGIP